MTDETIDYFTCDMVALIEHANRAGVHYLLPPITGTHRPERLMVRNHRDPEGQRIVEAIRARRDDVTAFLRANRPAPLTISPDEERYRREVLHEEDIPISDLTLPMLKAMIIRVALEVRDAERSAEEWEANVASRDAAPAPVQERTPRRAQRRREAQSDRVVY